jgi:hypothetical protein
MNAGNVSAEADRIGRKARNSSVLEQAVRVGLVAYGIVHLLIAWIAIELAFGSDQGSASSSGALSQLAKAPMGGVLLYVVAAGFAALVVWQLLEAFTGHRDEEGGTRLAKRAGSGLKAVVYAALGWSAFKVALGGGSSGDNTETLTAKVMSMPAGQLLVGAVGLVILAVGSRLIYRGLSEEFKDQLDVSGHVGNSGTAYVTLGKVGYVAKGLSFFIVAGLFVWAAATHDAKKSGGLDQALHTLLGKPFGVPLILLLGAGIACYGLYAFAWARHVDT